MLKSSIEIYNRKTQTMELYIEPIPELYLLQPNSTATVIALFTTQADKDNADFAVELTNESALVVYVNGLADDCYVEVNGKKILPVG